MGYDYTIIDGQRVEVHVAAAYQAMAAAFKQDTGLTLRIDSGTRTRAEQEDLYRRYRAGTYPYLVARPGTSNHEEDGPSGPRSIDIGDSGADAGVKTRGTIRDRWMERNAGRFGFENEGYTFSRVEAWHKTFRGSLDGPVAGSPASTTSPEEDDMPINFRNLATGTSYTMVPGISITAHPNVFGARMTSYINTGIWPANDPTQEQREAAGERQLLEDHVRWMLCFYGFARLGADLGRLPGPSQTVWSDQLQFLSDAITPGIPGVKFDGELVKEVKGAAAGIAALIASKPGADVDEAELARVLAPLITGSLTRLSDDDIARVAKAAADEQSRRLQS